ncbi:MAG: Gfo/Idh/MocA family oxidoreductase [Bacteroidales bacterium]
MTKRREFIRQGLVGTAGIAIGGAGFSARSYASIIGSNDRINVAVIGIRGQGELHINRYASLKENRNVRILTLCDTDEQYFNERANLAEKLTGHRPGVEWDLRKVFDNKDIHAVSFATPNHWHALGTIWACQAGKHVYVEKPACHNVFEGEKMVEAARKYDVRVQVGFQNRSIRPVMEAIAFLREGGIGQVFMARGLCLKPRDSFGIAADSQPPASLHYDRWLGPAPWRPYNEKRVHYNWHWHWDTGNGDTGNQGPHQFDIARWGLGQNEHPETIYSSGGIYGISPDECSQETPNTQSSLFRYSNGQVIQFETRGRFTNPEGRLNITIGNIFYGTEGYLEINASTWKAWRKREKEPFAGSDMPAATSAVQGSYLAAPGGAEHYANFIDAIRSGRDADLTSPVTEGVLSSALPHLANIAYRVGRELKFVGSHSRFVNAPEADLLLTRKYREPYVVPEMV